MLSRCVTVLANLNKTSVYQQGKCNKNLTLLFIFCFISGWRFLILAMLSVATAMLCKEQGITVTGVCTIYEVFVAQKVRNFFIKKHVSTIFCIVYCSDKMDFKLVQVATKQPLSWTAPETLTTQTELLWNLFTVAYII